MIKINNEILEPYFIDYSYEYLQWDFEFDNQKMRILLNRNGFVEFYLVDEDGETLFVEYHYDVCIQSFCKEFRVKGSFTASDYFVEIDGIFTAQEVYPLPNPNTNPNTN